MEKQIMLYVKLPMSGKSFDFWVPNSMRMGMASRLICKAIANLEPDYFVFTGDQTLMYERTGQVQDPNATVGEIGFVDGDTFVVV